MTSESEAMSSNLDVISLDVRGEICPVPLVKAMEAMRAASKGRKIEIMTDFLPAVLTVTNAALKEGWNINIRKVNLNEWRVLLYRAEEAGLLS